MRTYRAIFPFSGSGLGARGIQNARMEAYGVEARFVNLGGIDIDQLGCKDFEKLTGAPAHCRKIESITPAELREWFGAEAPHLVFLSPPCKGSSTLLSKKQSRRPKYQRMNKLALVWIRTMLQAWPDPPALILIENVPRIKTRAAAMVRRVRSMLREAGYVLHDGYHECGELGGLAQMRKRWLLVARHSQKVPALLYEPPKRRVRGIGEVIAELPVPLGGAGGRLHTMPRLSWRNWIRLALIPAGGDWRDLPGVLGEGEARRSKFRRYQVQRWEDPSVTVAASHGPNGAFGIADPRARHFGNVDRVTPWDKPAGTVTHAPAPSSGGVAVADPRLGLTKPGQEHWAGAYGVQSTEEPSTTVIGHATIDRGKVAIADPRFGLTPDGFEGRRGRLGVKAPEEPSATVTGNGRVETGAFSIADPRLGVGFSSDNPQRHENKLRVEPWDKPAHTVTGTDRIGSGAPSVADPRVAPESEWHPAALGVSAWDDPGRTVTGEGRPTNGRFSVADPRVEEAYDHGYLVLRWDQPSFTVAGKSHPGNGAFSVADPRVPPGARELFWSESDVAWVIVDPATGAREIVDLDKTPKRIPVILSQDGTWHRPLTPLELAALQSFPTKIDGEWLDLAGSITACRERIGNAVPEAAATAIARQMLATLLASEFCGFALGSSDTPVWVDPSACERVS